MKVFGVEPVEVRTGAPLATVPSTLSNNRAAFEADADATLIAIPANAAHFTLESDRTFNELNFDANFCNDMVLQSFCFIRGVPASKWLDLTKSLYTKETPNNNEIQENYLASPAFAVKPFKI